MSDINIHPEDTEAFFDRAKVLARQLDQGADVLGNAHLSFESVEGLLRVLTPNRWALLRTLKATGDTSIRALGIALRRDYKAVHSDVMGLIEAGLVMRGATGLISVPWNSLSAEMTLEAA